MVSRFKYSPDGRFTVGMQDDGITKYPFATFLQGRLTFGLYLIAFKSPDFLVETRF